MKRVATSAALLGLCAALMLKVSVVRAEAPKAVEPETIEKQIDYLRGAFIEALQTRDWKMLEMAGKGFNASGLQGKDLEISMLRAERRARRKQQSRRSEPVWRRIHLAAPIDYVGLILPHAGR